MPVSGPGEPASAALLEALPDLVLLIRRDGVVLGYSAGRSVPGLRPAQQSIGQRVEEVWGPAIGALLRQLTRKVIASRAAIDATVRQEGQRYEVRVSPQGPERAICVIRPVLAAGTDDTLGATGAHRHPHLGRRAFLKRLRESLALAALRDAPLALAAIQLEGIGDIAQLIAASVSELVLAAALLRLPTRAADEPPWYLGQLGEGLLAVVIETSDAAAAKGCLTRICDSLREPVGVGGGEFHLTPHAGVAIHGQDAATPKRLLDHARAAAGHARLAGSAEVCFFTDTLALESLSRLDIARELQQAIVRRDIRLRYSARHDLSTGRRVGWVGYLRWHHPLRGEIRPAEFLRVAEATGLAASLSRAMLDDLPRDFATLCDADAADVRISFGALRHHILHEHFLRDIEQFLARGGLPAERLELRIGEQAFIAREPGAFAAIARTGVRLVVDEVARGMGSLDWLARAPLWGLQLDRAWVTALRTDAVAQKVCRAGISMAGALGLTPMATGVDDSDQRDALLSLGCRYGTGDLFDAAPVAVRSAG